MPWEIRWYHRGKIPFDVYRWFENLRKVTFEDRIDYYFPKKDYDFVGVKIRGDSEKKLECKWRLETQNFVSSNGKVSGTLERWEKWSWKEDPSLFTNFASLADNASSVVKIDKKRRQIKFEIRTDEEIKDVDRIGDDIAGGSTELTDLVVRNQTWWSLAVELVGKNWDKKQNLENLLNSVLKDYPGPELEDNNSYGYPKWITII